MRAIRFDEQGRKAMHLIFAGNRPIAQSKRNSLAVLKVDSLCPIESGCADVGASVYVRDWVAMAIEAIELVISFTECIC